MPAALARAALLRWPVRFDQGEQRGCRFGRHRHYLDSGARRPGTSLDQPADRDRLSRADRVKRAGAIVGEQLHHKPAQVARVNDLNRLPRVAGQGHPATAGGPPRPVSQPVLPVVRPGYLSGSHDRGPRPVSGHHIVLARDLERTVGILGEFLSVTYRWAAQSVLG